MLRFASKDMAELAHQLTLSPKRQRLAQVQGVERLLGLVCPDKAYPYDMVCFHITGYRKRRETTKTSHLPGDKLAGDLVAMAEQITRKNALPVSELPEGYRTHEELASDLDVSTKTIRRWRVRGLMGVRALFADGISRLVYLPQTIERFSKQNKDLIQRGASFKQLTEDEKARMVELAREILGERRLKLHVVAKQIAARTGRAVETIRYTLRRFDQANPDDAMFSGNGLPRVSETHRRIWGAFEGGEPAGSIAAVMDMTVDSVEAILREMQVRQLKSEPVECMHNELFDAPDADALILGVPEPPNDPKAKRIYPPKDLPEYVRSLYHIPLLTAEQEVDLFRRYNYLKHKTARLVGALDPCDVTQAELGAVAELISRYEDIKQRIIKANLRLVISIAKKHVGGGPAFFETVSDGNISLMRAVEKFDYGRGFKFSTYASWAIMKNYARTIPEKRYHVCRYVTGQDELLHNTADHRAPAEVNLDKQKVAQSLRNSMRELDERERDIVTSHFGLFGSGPSKTLEQLGTQYGVTKERVRQIERRAINKMKTLLSPSLADVLPV